MTCQQCGEPCQGQYCQFHQREQSRKGDWQDQLENAGDLPEEDPLAFLGADVHKCDVCQPPRVFGSLNALANHQHRDRSPTIEPIQDPSDPRLDTRDTGIGRTTRGPTPGAQSRWDAEHVKHGGDSR